MSELRFQVEKTVLDPDNPVLEQFQKALKEHLLIQIAQTKQELLEIDEECKHKQEEYENVGVLTYNAQTYVSQNQEQLNSVIESIKVLNEKQKTEAEDLEINTIRLKNQEVDLFKVQQSNRDLQREIESIKLLNDKIFQYDRKISEEVQVSSLKVHRQETDLRNLSEEKKKQDYILHQCHIEINNLESELETMNNQIQIKELELEVQEAKLVDLNITGDALKTEYNALMSSWQNVCSEVSKRNESLKCVKSRVNHLNSKQQILIGQQKKVKNLINEELKTNQLLNYFKEKVDNMNRLNKKELTDQNNIRKLLENDINQITGIIKETENQTVATKAEQYKITVVLDHLIKEIELLIIKKTEMENEIIKMLDEQSVNEYSFKKQLKQYQERKIKAHDMKIKLCEGENKKQQHEHDILEQKHQNEALQYYAKELKQYISDLESELHSIKVSSEQNEFKYRFKIKVFHALSVQLQKELNFTEKHNVPQAEAKIAEYEKSLAEYDASIMKFKELWINEQYGLYKISADRQAQINEEERLKKQILLQEHKSKIFDLDLKNLQDEQKVCEKNIKQLERKLDRILSLYSKQKGKKLSLNEDMTFLKSSYYTELKHEELNIIKLEADIAEIEEDKLKISKQLLQINRECLEWETKLQLAIEVLHKKRELDIESKESLKKRAEINTMQTTYKKLKKIQENIVKEMTKCLSVRERLYKNSEICGANKKPPLPKNLTCLKRKISCLKNRIQHVKNEIKKSKDTAEDTKSEIAKSNKKIKDTTALIDNLKIREIDVLTDLEDAKIDLKLKFDLLCYNEKKLVLMKNIYHERDIYTIYRHYDLVKMYKKETEINKLLKEIVSKLKGDFPEMAKKLTIPYNSLEVASIK